MLGEELTMPTFSTKSLSDSQLKRRGSCPPRWLLAALVLFSMSTTSFGQNEYSFSLAGKPFMPKVKAVVGAEGVPQEGDLVEVRGFWVVLGPPGSYKFDGDRDRVFAAVDAQARQLVAARVDEESNPLQGLSGEQLSHLRAIDVYEWRPEMAILLPQLPADCYVKLYSYYDHRTGVRHESLPRLAPNIHYLEVEENSNFGFTDYSGLERSPNLIFLSLESMTLEHIEAAWLSKCRELRRLEVGRRNDLRHAEALQLPNLRCLTARLDSSISGLAWLSHLPALQVLDVSASQGLEDLSGLEGHPSLRVVDAEGCPIKRLPVSKVPALQRLSILGAGLSPEVANPFSTANPGALRYSYLQELRKALARANRVRVRSGGTCHRIPSEEETLFEVTDSSAIGDLLEAIEVDDTQSGFECMCCGEPTLEFYEGETLLGSVGFHHGQFLRWSEGWPGDAFLTEKGAEVLGDWMAAHGLPGPKLAGEATRRQMRQGEMAWEQATANLPEPVKTALAGLGYDAVPGRSKLSDALKATYPAPGEQVVTLYRVIGRPGPWNPFQSFEGQAEEELETYPQEVLRVALDKAFADSDPRAQLGAARFWSANYTALEWELPAGQADRVLDVLLASPSAWIRQLGVWRVKRWSGRGIDAPRHLAFALADPDSDVRRAAILCVGLVGSESLAPELLNILGGKMRELCAPYQNSPEDDYTNTVGGTSSDSDLAAIALGLMGYEPAVEQLLNRPPSPSREVGLALLGQPERLQKYHFSQPDGNTELQLAAVTAVARSKGLYGLSWALNYDSEADFAGSLEALEILRQMLKEQGAPGLEELEACEELEDLKAWYQKYGDAFLRRARSRNG